MPESRENAGVTFPTSGSLCSRFAQLSCFGELKGFVLRHSGLILKHVSCSPYFDVDACHLPSIVFCKAQSSRGERTGRGFLEPPYS